MAKTGCPVILMQPHSVPANHGILGGASEVDKEICRNLKQGCGAVGVGCFILSEVSSKNPDNAPLMVTMYAQIQMSLENLLRRKE